MPLQNRVTPLGEIVADPARGTLMGNRGVLHGLDRQLGASRWRHKTWIACRLDFKARRRPVMAPGRYTELFFLDEATSLAAGHRPCAECRRADYLRFRAAWTRAQGLDEPPSATAMDAVLHAHRVDRARSQRTHEADLAGLPDGAFVSLDGGAWLKRGGRIHRWSPSGYDESRVAAPGIVAVLTPAPTVAALAAGYAADIHASLEPSILR